MKKLLKKTIIFDFDGVILDSNFVKSETFYNLFKKFGIKKAKKVLKYHIKFMGIPRREKFKYIYKNILKKKINLKQIEELDYEFKEKSLKKISKLKVNKSLFNFLIKKYVDYNFYISTGAPKNEIIELLKKKKLFKNFKKVYGPPSKKTQHINIIKKLNKSDIIFIGDSLEDHKAAKKCKIKFILKKHRENINIFKNKKVFQISNFKNFENKINDIF